MTVSELKSCVIDLFSFVVSCPISDHVMTPLGVLWLCFKFISKCSSLFWLTTWSNNFQKYCHMIWNGTTNCEAKEVYCITKKHSFSKVFIYFTETIFLILWSIHSWTRREFETSKAQDFIKCLWNCWLYFIVKPCPTLNLEWQIILPKSCTLFRLKIETSTVLNALLTEL